MAHAFRVMIIGNAHTHGVCPVIELIGQHHHGWQVQTGTVDCEPIQSYCFTAIHADLHDADIALATP